MPSNPRFGPLSFGGLFLNGSKVASSFEISIVERVRLMKDVRVTVIRLMRSNPKYCHYSGYSGAPVRGGLSGTSGYSGSGLSGYSGTSGYSGYSGTSGYAQPGWEDREQSIPDVLLPAGLCGEIVYFSGNDPYYVTFEEDPPFLVLYEDIKDALEKIPIDPPPFNSQEATRWILDLKEIKVKIQKILLGDWL